MALGDSIQITEGSGKRLATGATYTENAQTVRDEKAIIGEQYLATYTVGVSSANSTATAASHLIQLMAGSALKVRIRRIELHQYDLATGAALMHFSVLRLTTAGTGGTATTPNPLDPASAAAGATARHLPTAKGTEGAAIVTSRLYLMQTIGASAQLNQPLIAWDFDGLRMEPLIIAAGTANGICIKNHDAVAGAAVFASIWFTETPF